MHLFATVGTSPAILIEAVEWCLGAEGGFGSGPCGKERDSQLFGIWKEGGFARPEKVHVLGTESLRSSADELAEAFGAESDGGFGIPLELWIPEGLAQIESMEDQMVLEEAIYLAYRRALDEAGGPSQLLVCIAGGYKTMTATLQKAATQLGARQLFHVIAAPNDKGEFPLAERSSVRDAAEAGKIQVFPLGEEPGWATFRAVSAPPWTGVVDRGGGDGATSLGVIQWDSTALHYRRDLKRAQAALQTEARGRHFEQELFAALAYWPEGEVESLNAPLDPDNAADAAWVLALPKIELHCHLGGFGLDPERLLALAAAVRSEGGTVEKALVVAAEIEERQGEVGFPDGWPLPTEPVGLDPYMNLGNLNGSRILSSPAALRLQVKMLYAALMEDHVCYAEIRCSPNNYSSPGRPAWTVLEDIVDAFAAARAEALAAGGAVCEIRLIVIASRKRDGDLSDISRHLSLAVTAADAVPVGEVGESYPGVVGVDLAGFEIKETRPMYFKTDYHPVHRCGLNITVHAGENDNVESVWQAIYELKADRLGHALALSGAEELQRVVARKGIGIELCPYANVQIAGFAPLSGDRVYPLREFLDAGIRVTVNTDNPGISSATLTENLLLVARLCPERQPLTRAEVLKLQRNALEVAFVGPQVRSRIAGEMNRRLEGLFEHGG